MTARKSSEIATGITDAMDPTPTPLLNIYQRIDLAYTEIAKADFSKSGTVKGAQSYKFIPIDQILDTVRKAHAKYGVKVVFGRPKYDAGNFEKRWDYVKKGNYGETTWHAAVGHIKVRLIGASDYDSIELRFDLVGVVK